MKYSRFATMIATSTVVMFVLMYLNTYALDHVWFSQTRAWMALVMGAAMAVIMLAFMLEMYASTRANLVVIADGINSRIREKYKDRSANLGIVIAALVVGLVSSWFMRSQATVDDVAYMKAMIPHHSIAVLTSQRAGIRDPRVRRLADGIIETQVREIAQMKQLIRDLEEARDQPPRT